MECEQRICQRNTVEERLYVQDLFLLLLDVAMGNMEKKLKLYNILWWIQDVGVVGYWGEVANKKTNGVIHAYNLSFSDLFNSFPIYFQCLCNDFLKKIFL